MNLLLALVVGGIVGWAASRLLGRDEGLLAGIIIGIVGSIIGGFLSMLIRGSHQAYLTFSWPSLFWSFIGALLFVALLNAVQGSPHRYNS